jgi:5'-deoxynucleotidase YfbR-like HD superfamily hydrolase
MTSGPDIFRDFVDRDADLRALIRYNMYTVMFYRTNLYSHSHRVAALVRAINPLAQRVFGGEYDPRKAEVMALVHDDPELIFGDIQAGNKIKMTPEQLAAVKITQEQAIEDIAARFPTTVDGYSYVQLLREVAHYSSLEVQVMRFADKYDGMGEAFHEVHAGNMCFVTNVVNEYGRIPTPPPYHVDYFQQFGQEFPDLRPLLAEPFELFEPVEHQDYTRMAAQGRLHTIDSLSAPTGDHHYDAWKRIVIADTNDEVAQDLWQQKEF